VVREAKVREKAKDLVPTICELREAGATPLRELADSRAQQVHTADSCDTAPDESFA
jgi:hypothetical protein